VWTYTDFLLAPEQYFEAPQLHDILNEERETLNIEFLLLFLISHKSINATNAARNGERQRVQHSRFFGWAMFAGLVSCPIFELKPGHQNIETKPLNF